MNKKIFHSQNIMKAIVTEESEIISLTILCIWMAEQGQIDSECDGRIVV